MLSLGSTIVITVPEGDADSFVEIRVALVDDFSSKFPLGGSETIRLGEYEGQGGSATWTARSPRFQNILFDFQRMLELSLTLERLADTSNEGMALPPPE